MLFVIKVRHGVSVGLRMKYLNDSLKKINIMITYTVAPRRKPGFSNKSLDPIAKSLESGSL